MRNYRATPHTTTWKICCRNNFYRRFKTRIHDFIDNKVDGKDENICKKDAQEKEKIKYYADKRNNTKPHNISIGDKVILRKRQTNKTLPYYDPNPYIVYSKTGNIIIARRDAHATRNSSFFKVFQNMLDNSYSDYEEQKNKINKTESNIT